MKKLNLMALLVGAALFTGLGATSALAESGKCGDAKEMKKGKCGEGNTKGMKCGEGKGKGAGKCGKGEGKAAGKCSGEKKAPAKGKCGAGKCG